MAKTLQLEEALRILESAGMQAVNRSKLNTALKMAQEAGYAVGYKHDLASSSLGNTPALQGPLQGDPTRGGAFAAPGVRPERYSALQRVRSLASLLTPEPNEFYNEKISILTGATGTQGDNVANYCDPNPPQPGALKQCTQNFQFGDWYSATHVNNVNKIGYLLNRADIPGIIRNTGPMDNPLVPDILWRLADTRDQLALELYLQGIMMERALEPVLINGDPTKAHTDTEIGFIKEFLGLSSQIKTGYEDFDSGRTCEAADSIVINFNTTIGGTIGGGDGRTITTTIGDLVYAVRDRAKYVGMRDGLELAFIMREEVFRVLTDYYANTYATSRFQAATLTAGSPVIQIATEANNLRLEMLNGQFLLVEGLPIPVIFSDGMPFEGMGSNVYNTDIFLVPISWQGAKLLRFEYFNLGNPYASKYVNFVNGEDHMVINNGLYGMTAQKTAFCKQYLFASSQRLILEAPFLAGRIDNVQFTYLAATRNGTPGQSLYVNGGVSYYQPTGSY